MIPPSTIENPRRRDSQQWILDWVIKQTGREQNFEYDGRRLPAGVKNYAMIPASLNKAASHAMSIAEAAERAGHARTAAELYYRAAELYSQGQHAIFEDDNDDKIFLYEQLTKAYDRVIALTEYTIERVEIPFEGRTVAGLLHLVPGGGAKPTVLYLPGMDQVKETVPVPHDNPFLDRGMNVLSLDGPGQGSSNIRKIRVTADNYERAASAAIDYLVTRPEVDADRIGVIGSSMGSYWSMRLASIDRRVKAVASTAACYASKRHIFEQSSPRFKQIFMYMAGEHDEDAFDEMASSMHLDGHAARITAPTLMLVGEFDPLSPLDESLEVYRQLAGPKEIMVLENDFHGSGRAPGTNMGNFAGLTTFPIMCDWVRDELTGDRPHSGSREILVPQGRGSGPYGPTVAGYSLRERS